MLAIGGTVFLLTRALVRGKFGRAFAIVKGNENVASSMGISPYLLPGGHLLPAGGPGRPRAGP
ncbi:hypothetical protein A7K94_0209170 [Modestobacter sp. VKM Ac-2676]|nr:hypothetical protein A7K94_0209170 [Modestobacter sp. VKM Ac-2676]